MFFRRVCLRRRTTGTSHRKKDRAKRHGAKRNIACCRKNFSEFDCSAFALVVAVNKMDDSTGNPWPEPGLWKLSSDRRGFVQCDGDLAESVRKHRQFFRKEHSSSFEI